MNADILKKYLDGKEFIHFFDSENNQPAIIATKLVGKDNMFEPMPIIERSLPLSYSLDVRRKYDSDPTKIL